MRGSRNPNFGKPRIHGKTLWLKLPDESVVAVRSYWEAFFADKLASEGKPWSYEPETFILEDGSAYTPDFLCDGVYYELKGYMTEEDQRKVDGFCAKFPDKPLRVLGRPEMKTIGLPIKQALDLKVLVVVRGRELVCENCERRYLASSKTRRFCSCRCMAKWRESKKEKVRVSIVCVVCGRSKDYLPSLAKKRVHRTCSHNCSSTIAAKKRSESMARDGFGRWVVQ